MAFSWFSSAKVQVTVDDPKLIAKCGLYCGSCSSYKNGKCKGCTLNEKATWCQIRSCCLENDYGSCADCKTHTKDMKQCGKFHNPIGRTIGYILGSDRHACIARIREVGCEQYAHEMASTNRQTIHKGNWNPFDW